MRCPEGPIASSSRPSASTTSFLTVLLWGARAPSRSCGPGSRRRGSRLRSEAMRGAGSGGSFIYGIAVGPEFPEDRRRCGRRARQEGQLLLVLEVNRARVWQYGLDLSQYSIGTAFRRRRRAGGKSAAEGDAGAASSLVAQPQHRGPGGGGAAADPGADDGVSCH